MQPSVHRPSGSVSKVEKSRSRGAVPCVLCVFTCRAAPGFRVPSAPFYGGQAESLATAAQALDAGGEDARNAGAGRARREREGGLT